MSSPRQKLVVLGATGSIGVSTLDVVARHPDRFEVLALSAQNKIDRLAEQCRQFHPRYAVVGSENAASILDGMLRQSGIATTV
ncbi:MAG: 1-deoxy-D-xylulose-5-phosphate reductoisomerase, partial [Rhodocyclaceae bacterium]|nr:1-deoxy-D-xylulose-5-phosphate reductoisomerase [Rhodocyclaceae bacterium]